MDDDQRQRIEDEARFAAMQIAVRALSAAVEGLHPGFRQTVRESAQEGFDAIRANKGTDEADEYFMTNFSSELDDLIS